MAFTAEWTTFFDMNGSGSTYRPWGAIWLNILFGVWVIASPFRMGFAGNHPICWNNVAVGAAVIILNLANKRGFGVIRALLVLLGAWLFISPFVFGFSKTVISWNNLVMGVLIIIGAVFHRGDASHQCSREAGTPVGACRLSARLDNAQPAIHPIAASAMILTAYRLKNGKWFFMPRA